MTQERGDALARLTVWLRESGSVLRRLEMENFDWVCVLDKRGFPLVTGRARLQSAAIHAALDLAEKEGNDV